MLLGAFPLITSWAPAIVEPLTNGFTFVVSTMLRFHLVILLDLP